MGLHPQAVSVFMLLRSNSPLHGGILDGLKALKSAHVRDHLDEAIRPAFADSLDLDAALLRGNEQQHRWDYLMGHMPSGEVIAMEPHSANSKGVKAVIAKREAARLHLRAHLKPGARISAWLWIASGKVDFAHTEKAIRLLDQNGITFVGKQVLPKHLPAASVPVSAKPPKKRRPKPSIS